MNPDFQFIDTEEELKKCCKKLSNASVIALDTEFIRERTFYPIPGLIQVSDGKAIYLIDPQACKNLKPLFLLLEDERIQIIMHSSSEDIELLYHIGCTEIKGLFDTQIAASWLGMGQSISLQNLVEQSQSILIEKQLSRTDWLKRPLSDAQLTYAAIDVLYLITIYQLQLKELSAIGFLEYALEDCYSRCMRQNPGNFDETAYLKVKKAKTCTGINLVALQKLSAWRECQARNYDKPRQHVVKDLQLLAIANELPNNLDRLSEVSELQPHIVRRFGDSIIQTLATIKKDDQVNPALGFRSLPNAGVTLSACRELMLTLHLEQNYPREVLPSKRWLEQFLLHHIANWYPMPEGWFGWRRALLEEPILALIDENQFQLN